MIPSVLSRLVILLFGTLYPAYSSYKAVRTKNVKEYVKWMMYWIVYALFTCAETFTDIFFSFWFPFYYEFKIILVVYLLSPATNGSSILYRKFVHPVLTRKEQEKKRERMDCAKYARSSFGNACGNTEIIRYVRHYKCMLYLVTGGWSEEIDECIAKAMERGYHTMLNLGSRSVAYATSVIMQTAIKGGGGLVNHIRKSYSLDDINTRDGRQRKRDDGDEIDNVEEEERQKYRRRRNLSPRRTVSSGSQVDLYFPHIDEYNRSPVPLDENILSHIRSSEDISSGYSSTEPLYSSSKYGSKDQLIRTASMGPVTRNRSRLAKKQNSEDESGCSTTEPDESQIETDVPFLIRRDSVNFLAPFVKPEFQYLFASLAQQQMYSFINTATCLPEPAKSTPPSAILQSILKDGTVESGTVPADLDGVEKTKPDISAGVVEKYDSGISGDKAEVEKGVSDIYVDKAGERNEPETRSGKYNKRPAPIPPSCSDSVEDEGEFCTPGSSPVVDRKFTEEEIVESAVEAKTEESATESKPEKKTKHRSKGKAGESQISKMLHLSKLQFPFWNQKTGKHSPVNSECSSVSEMSRNSSHISLSSKSEQESFIPLKGDEAKDSVDVREMSESPSSKRRSFIE